MVTELMQCGVMDKTRLVLKSLGQSPKVSVVGSE